VADEPGEDGIYEPVGVSGVVRMGGRVYEEWHPKLQGILGVRAYREMRDNNDVIGGAIDLVQHMLRQVSWRAEPADASDAAMEQADFLTDCLEDMDHTWSEFMSEVISMLWFGWAWFEKTMKRRDDGRIGWKEISIRAQETLYEWKFDEETGNVTHMVQWAYPKLTQVSIPLKKSILFRTESNKNSPEGRSVLRKLWRTYKLLTRDEEFEGIEIERNAAGLVVMTLPLDIMQEVASAEKKAMKATFAKMSQQIRRNEHEGVLFPPELDREGKPTGYSLKLLQGGGGSRQSDIGSTIQRLRTALAMGFSTQFQFLGQAGATGSFALSSDQTDLFGLALGAVLKNIAETFNRFAVRELFELNGVPRELHPKLVHGDIEKQDVVRFADCIAKLVDCGALHMDKPMRDYVRAEMDFPDEEETEEAPPSPAELEAARAVAANAAQPTLPTGPAEAGLAKARAAHRHDT
jgi:hypothetical protein